MTHSFGFGFMPIGSCLLSACLLSACSDYEVKFNDRALFTPTPLFVKYHLENAALNDCVRQTIVDKRISAAEDLEIMVCTNAGIALLTGLSTFTGIEQLNLANNAITDIHELTQLSQLKLLDLSNNMITDVASLQTLAHLEEIRLTGNAALDCAQAEQLRTVTGALVSIPEHCDQDRII